MLYSVIPNREELTTNLVMLVQTGRALAGSTALGSILILKIYLVHFLVADLAAAPDEKAVLGAEQI